MIAFACPKCAAAHRVPPEQAGAKFRCGCGQKLQAPGTPPLPSEVATMQGVAVPPVDGTAPTSLWPTATNAPAAGSAPPAPEFAPPPPPPPAPVRVAPPPASKPPSRVGMAIPAPTRTEPPRKQWHYELDGRAVGPIPEADLKLLAENGTLLPDARVWTDGMATWEPSLAIVPRAFVNVELDAESGWGVQRVAALILATVAVAAVVIFIVVAVKGKPAESKTSDTRAERSPVRLPHVAQRELARSDTGSSPFPLISTVSKL